MRMENYKKHEWGRAGRVLMIGACLAAICQPAYSHLRWFVEDSSSGANATFSFDIYTVGILVGAGIFLALALLVDAHPRARALARRMRLANVVTGESAWRTIAVLSGVMLLANAASDAFLAPNLVLDPPLIMLGRIAQIVLGVLLISQLTFVVCGVVAIVAFLLGATQFPPMLMLDYVFEFAALGLGLIFIGPSINKLDRAIVGRFTANHESLRALAVPTLRIGLGLALMVLAVHNKFLNPNLGLAFQEEHAFNFMPWLGFEGFSNLHFVLAAGVAEFMFGLMLVTGVATRFISLSVGAFFLTTLIILGPIELVGHAPIIGIIMLLIIEGDGGLRFRAFNASTESSQASDEPKLVAAP